MNINANKNYTNLLFKFCLQAVYKIVHAFTVSAIDRTGDQRVDSMRLLISMPARQVLP